MTNKAHTEPLPECIANWTKLASSIDYHMEQEKQRAERQAAQDKELMAVITELRKAIYGNGQPGIVGDIREADRRLRELESVHKDAAQIAKDKQMERFKWVLAVGLLVITSILNIASNLIVKTP